MNVRISRTEQWEYTASANGVQGTGGSPEMAELNLLRKIIETQTTCGKEQKKLLNLITSNLTNYSIGSNSFTFENPKIGEIDFRKVFSGE